MTIRKITAPGFGCTQFGLASVARTHSVLLCETDNHVIERLIIEFDNEEMAVRFQRKMEANEAEIQIDEDTSIKVAPRRLQNQYFRCLLKGDVERLHKLLDTSGRNSALLPATNKSAKPLASGDWPLCTATEWKPLACAGWADPCAPG